MNAFNRLVVLIVSLLVQLAGVLIILAIAEVVDPEEIPGNLLSPQLKRVAISDGAELWTNVGIAAGLMLGGLMVLVMELRPLLARPKMVLVSSGPEGAVRIALDSIRELAEKTGRGNRAVKQVRCRVGVASNGLRIRCLVSLKMGSDVPKVGSELQSATNDVVERLTGLPVVDVAVRARYSGDDEVSLLAR